MPRQAPLPTRKCRDCRARKAVEEFPERNDPLSGRSVRRKICRECWAERQAECYQQDVLPRYAQQLKAGAAIVIAARAISRFRSVVHLRGSLHPTHRLFCGRAWERDLPAIDMRSARPSDRPFCRDCLSELELFSTKMERRHGASLTALRLCGDTAGHELPETDNSQHASARSAPLVPHVAASLPVL